MDQPLHNQPSLSKDMSLNPSSHPKIRPIVSLDSQRKELLGYRAINQTKKLMTLRSKNSRVHRFCQGMPQRPKPQLARNASEVLRAQNSLKEFDYAGSSLWAFQNALFAAKLKTFSTVSSLRLHTLEELRCFYLKTS